MKPFLPLFLLYNHTLYNNTSILDHIEKPLTHGYVYLAIRKIKTVSSQETYQTYEIPWKPHPGLVVRII